MLESLFGNAGYIPHGYCLSWAPGLVALHLVSDAVIAAAYFSIPVGIFYFLRRRADFPYRRLAMGFAAFIVCCGVTHLFSAFTLWFPYYGLEGVMKAVTGGVSLMTAVALWPMLPKLISLPSPAELRDANKKLQAEIEERRGIEAELLQAREQLEQAIAARTAALRATESRLRAAIEAAVNAVIVIDRVGTIETFNKSAERMFGRTAEEAIGKNVKVLMPEEHAIRHDGYLSEYLRTGESRVIGEVRELTGQRSDGSIFPIELSVAEAVPNETFVGTITDITDRKQAEAELLERAEQLQRSNEELEQFANVASHDLQEPLRMVRSYCELLQQRYGDVLDAEGREFLGYAVEGANRMRELIQDLLRLSRIGTGAVAQDIVDCNKLMQQVRDDLRARIEECDARIEVDDLPTVRGNSGLLRQVLQNLVGNAIKFRKSDTVTVRVSVTAQNGYWEFSVEDDGIGIDAKYAERIFTIFQRLHTRDEFPGNGMGLAICRKVMERHGGTIHLDTGVTTGSRFVFTLPRGRGSDLECAGAERVGG